MSSPFDREFLRERLINNFGDRAEEWLDDDPDLDSEAHVERSDKMAQWAGMQGFEIDSLDDLEDGEDTISLDDVAPEDLERAMAFKIG